MWQQILKRVRGGGGGGPFTPFVGAYGKLPCIGDFVSVRAKTEPALGFQGWLARAVDWGDRKQLPGWPSVFDGRPAVAFTFRPRPKNGGILVGLIKASRDVVGRRYPFALFSAVSDEVACVSPHLQPLAMATFIEQAQNVLPAMERATSSAEVEANLAALQIVESHEHLTHAYDGWIRSTPAMEFWYATYGTADGAGPNYAIQMIGEVLAPFRNVEEPPTDIAVRLPVKDSPYHVAFWFDLIQRLGGIRRPTPTSLCYPSPGLSGRALFVTLGDSHPSALCEASVGSGDTDLVCDLTTPTPSRTSVSNLPVLPSRIESEIRRETATLADVLDALHPR